MSMQPGWTDLFTQAMGPPPAPQGGGYGSMPPGGPMPPGGLGPSWQDYMNNMAAYYGAQAQQGQMSAQTAQGMMGGFQIPNVSVPSIGMPAGAPPGVPGGGAENAAALGAFGAINPQQIAGADQSALGAFMAAQPGISNAMAQEYSRNIWSQYSQSALQAQQQYLQDRTSAMNNLMSIGLQAAQSGMAPQAVQQLLSGMAQQEGFPSDFGAFGQALGGFAGGGGLSPNSPEAQAIGGAIQQAFQKAGGNQTRENIYSLAKTLLPPQYLAMPNLDQYLNQFYMAEQGAPGAPYYPNTPAAGGGNAGPAGPFPYNRVPSSVSNLFQLPSQRK